MTATTTLDATIEETIHQALARARAWGCSAFISVRARDEEQPKPIFDAWKRALITLDIGCTKRRSDSRTSYDHQGRPRTETTEMLFEIWPNDEEWEMTPPSAQTHGFSATARSHATP